MSGPRPRTLDRSLSWSPPARCTSTASGPLPDALALSDSTGLASSTALPLPISLLPPFRKPAVPLVDDLLVLGALLLGRSLWSPSGLPFLWPIDFLADFIALPTAFRVNILTIVFTTTLPMPSICLVLLSRCGCLTREFPQGTSGPVLCPVV